MNKIKILESLINTSKNIVVMTGAGFSKASGIPDFRSSDGIYNNHNENISPEEILSLTYFNNNYNNFYAFYFNNMIYENALPNVGHYKLFELEKSGRLKSIITQNIDGLHQLAGCKNVLELHGSVLNNYCLTCKKYYSLNELLKMKHKPRCSKCNGLIKPKVTLYEEMLDEQVLDNSIKDIQDADLLIIAGTSLLVSPAANLPYLFRGKYIVIINLEKTPFDKYASLVINDYVEQVLSKIEILNIDKE